MRGESRGCPCAQRRLQRICPLGANAYPLREGASRVFLVRSKRSLAAGSLHVGTGGRRRPYFREGRCEDSPLARTSGPRSEPAPVEDTRSRAIEDRRVVNRSAPAARCARLLVLPPDTQVARDEDDVGRADATEADGAARAEDSELEGRGRVCRRTDGGGSACCGERSADSGTSFGSCRSLGFKPRCPDRWPSAGRTGRWRGPPRPRGSSRTSRGWSGRGARTTWMRRR